MELKADKKVIVERNNKVVYDNGDTVVKVFSGSKPSADLLNEALNSLVLNRPVLMFQLLQRSVRLVIAGLFQPEKLKAKQ